MDPVISNPKSFNYATLSPEASQFVQKETSEIRSLMKRSAQDIAEIGQKFINVKEQLGHGKFLDWLKAEFDWGHQTAKRFMNVAQQFGQIQQFVEFAPSALYILSEPSVPAEAREEAVTRAKMGEVITYQTAKQIKRRYVAPKSKAKLGAKQAEPAASTTIPLEDKAKSETQISVELPHEKTQFSHQQPQILAIRPRELAQTAVSSLEAEPVVVPAPSSATGTWWQLGSHLLYCGSSLSARFRERLPASVALVLSFPPTANWQLDDRIVLRASSILTLFTLYQDQDSKLLTELVERSLLLYTEGGQSIIFSFLPDPNLLLLADHLDCRCYIAEPDERRCKQVILSWKQKGHQAKVVQSLRF